MDLLTSVRVTRMVLCLLVSSSAGCATRPSFPMPMTARDFLRFDSASALVAYLSQPDADTAICDLHARGPHLSALSDEVSQALASALVGDDDTPPLPASHLHTCALALLQSAPRERSAALLDAFGERYRDLIRSPELETSPQRQQQLSELQQVYLERPHDTAGSSSVAPALFAELREALHDKLLGPVATHFGTQLLAAFDLESDRWSGRPVSAATIEALFAAHDESALRLFASRLHSPALRAQSKRRIVRLRIAGSAYPEVREHATEIEDKVLSTGNNPVALPDDALLRAELYDPPWQAVVLRQNLESQTALLAGETREHGLSAQLPLRNVLLVYTQKLARPITLCAASEELDPDPCIPPARVTLDSPLAQLDAAGVLHLQGGAKLSDLIALLRSGGRFKLPARIQQLPITGLEWQLRVARPDDLVLSANTAGADGPDLDVAVDCAEPNVLLFSLTGSTQPRFAAIEAPDLEQFTIVSRGAQGSPGFPGAAGSNGVSGGACRDGTNGGNGQPGGDGQPGGNGGRVAVHVACHSGTMNQLLQTNLQRAVISVGGPGGEPGPGGPGGMGGSGGPAVSNQTHTDARGTVVVDQAGCTQGISGINGARGLDGRPGPNGRAGSVAISFEEAQP